MPIGQMTRNTMKNLASLVLGSSILTGCNMEVTKRDYSANLHEDAKVVDVVYSPSRHGDGSAVGLGMDLTGEGGISIVGSDVNINIPAKYAVVFQCQHGKFIIEGKDEEHKKLWEKFVEGDLVDVTYREVYNSTYKDIDGDGKRDLIKRNLVDYDFIGADKK